MIAATAKSVKSMFPTLSQNIATLPPHTVLPNATGTTNCNKLNAVYIGENK
jgi:hypothetical protein